MIVHRIDEGVRGIRRRIAINTWIFSVLALGTVTIGIVAILLVRQGTEQAKQSLLNYQLATESLQESAKANARLEASDAIYMTYIKTTVGQILDKLSRDNPQIRVPRNPEPRPPGLPPITDSDLDRPLNEQPRPAPTPRPQTRTSVKYRSKPKPTPKPWYDFFKSPR